MASEERSRTIRTGTAELLAESRKGLHHENDFKVLLIGHCAAEREEWKIQGRVTDNANKIKRVQIQHNNNRPSGQITCHLHSTLLTCTCCVAAMKPGMGGIW